MSIDDDPVTRRDFTYLKETLDTLNTTLVLLKNEISENYVRKDVLTPQLIDMKADIETHSRWLEWAQRLVIGAVIAALISGIILVGK